MVIIGGLTGVPGGDTMLLLDIDIFYLDLLEMLQRLWMVKQCKLFMAVGCCAVPGVSIF